MTRSCAAEIAHTQVLLSRWLLHIVSVTFALAAAGLWARGGIVLPTRDLPMQWRYSAATQGWKQTFYLDPRMLLNHNA